MFVFAPAPQAVVPVSGEKNVFFPVNRVYCVGRNYADHDKEMGGTGKTTPCFFSKPADAVFPIDSGKTAQVPFPKGQHPRHDLVGCRSACRNLYVLGIEGR